MTGKSDVVIEQLLTATKEHETLEFKEAANQYSYDKLLEYCAALANEGGGRLVLGITDKLPRRVTGTQAFANLNDTKSKLFNKLRIRVSCDELEHSGKRVLVFRIPARPAATPVHVDGKYLMRVGESLVPMSPDQLKKIFAEQQEPFLGRLASEYLPAADALHLLEIQSSP